MEWHMAAFIETVIIAAVVALGILVGGAAIIPRVHNLAPIDPSCCDKQGRRPSADVCRYPAA